MIDVDVLGVANTAGLVFEFVVAGTLIAGSSLFSDVDFVPGRGICDVVVLDVVHGAGVCECVPAWKVRDGSSVVVNVEVHFSLSIVVRQGDAPGGVE